MNDRIQHEMTNNPTPDTMSRYLKQARRGNDLAGVLTACEGLHRSRCVVPGGAGPFAHSEQVREALRWVVGSETRRVTAEPSECCVIKDGVYRYHEGLSHRTIRDSTRIANLARMLPDPQPMALAHCGRCCGTGFMPELDGSNMDTGDCVACDGSGTFESDRPAPIHAFRLYVDALMLAKGDGWFDWLSDEWVRLEVGHTTEMRRRKDPPQRLMYDRTGAIIHRDGSIRCGAECPPLPTLEVQDSLEEDTL